MQDHPFSAEPLRFITCEGDAFSIGMEHAKAFDGQLARGMLGFYHNFWGLAFQSVKSRLPRWSHGLTERALGQMIRRRIGRMRETTREYLQGVSEGSGIDLELVGLVCLLPDLLPYLQGKRVQWGPAVYRSPQLGCTSLIARSDAGLVYGRNLDFPGVGYWDRFPVVQLSRKKNAIPSLHFTTMGIPLGGITGLNAEGISVSLHQHYSAQVNWRGELPFEVGEEILDKAKSLEDAKEVLSRSRLGSAWAFVVCDYQARDGFIYEADSRYHGLRRLSQQPSMSHSNYFRTAACQVGEFSTSERMDSDNYYRSRRLTELCEGQRPTATDVCRFMSDSVDPLLGEEKILGRTVSQTHNIQSVVVDGGHRLVYIAAGGTPVHQGFYDAYHWDDLFAGKTSPQCQGQAVPYQFRNQRVAEAKKHYCFSMSYSLSGESEKAFAALEQSVRAHTDLESALTWSQWLLKRDDPRSAIHVLGEQIDQSTQSSERYELRLPEVAEAELWLARAYRLAGQTGESEQIVKKILAQKRHLDNRLLILAKRVSSYTPQKLAQFTIPYSLYLPLE